MDFRLREITWVRLLALLLWTVLVMIKRGVTQLLDVIEGRIFELSEPQPRSRGQKRESEGTLLPPLDDDLVLRRIWPLLHRRVNVSLLWRLRRVNKAWKEKVGTTVEWAALEMVRLDTPGYLRLLAERRERRPSLQERVEREVRAFTILLSEHLVNYSSHLEMVSSWEDSLELIEDGRGRRSARIESEELGAGNPSDCSCGRKRCAYCESCGEIDGSGYVRSEEEEVEAYASSSDSSMMVYYPRHLMKVK